MKSPWREGFEAGVDWCAKHLEAGATTVELEKRAFIEGKDGRNAPNAIVKMASVTYGKALRDLAQIFREEAGKL